MATVKQVRTANLEQSHVVVLNKVTAGPQTLAQITASLGLNPGKDVDLVYVEHRLSLLCDEGLAKRTTGDRIANPQAPNRPVATYILL
jgi:hypothetical protein